MAIPNEPVTRQEQYLAAIADASGTLPDEPITRKEFYLAKAAGQDVETPPPITREEMYLDAIAEGGGGGGGEAVLINKSVTANGTYNASSDSADGYKKVTVNVPTREITLLASGTYTKADGASSSSMSIPVSFNGTPVQGFVEAETPVSGTTQTYQWATQFELESIIQTKFGYAVSKSKMRTTANANMVARGTMGLDAAHTSLTCSQDSNNYPIRDNTYNWYIWGYAE